MNGFVGMSPVSNEDILYTLAQVATTLAGFSGLVVVFRVRGAQAWSRAELRTFWFLLGDSFLVLFFSLIPLPLALANWSGDALWGLCNALLRVKFFLYAHIDHSVGLLFKDSISGTAEPS